MKTNLGWLALALALFMLLAGCRGDRSGPATAASAVGDAASTPPDSPWSGAVSEEEFKRMHQLRKDGAPALRGQMVQVQGAAAYLSLPQATPPLPAVLVIHEWWGLNDHIKHWTDRLAADGYAALAVDLYDGKVATTPDEAMTYMKRVEPEKALSVLQAGLAFLKDDPRVRASRRASIGWCFGGKWSLELALAAPDLNAAVVYYGHVTTDADKLATLKAPLLAIFGNRDQSIPPPHVDAFEQALKKNNASFTILRYDADHAFANPSGERYDGAAATEAWNQTRTFLAGHLRQPAPALSGTP